MAKKHRENTAPPVGNIYLAGFMCSGKTSAGRLLARRLGRPFADTDAQVARRAGLTVKELVSRRGWRAFRRLEEAELRRLAAGAGRVVALGGGLYPSARWRSLLERTGVTVFLDCPWPELARRLRDNAAGRPLLSGPWKAAGPRAKGLYARRLPFYRRAAVRVDAAGTPARTAELIRKEL